MKTRPTGADIKSPSGRVDAPPRPPRAEKPLWHKVLAPVSSLRLTVVLLALAIFLILSGTLAQIDSGIWDVQKDYFHSGYVTVDGHLFIPRNPEVIAKQNAVVRGLFKAIAWVKVPMPGGYTLGVLLLVNLIAAHAVRFKFVWGDLLLIPQLALIFAMLWQWQQSAQLWLLLAACGVGLLPLLTLAWLHGKRTGVILIHLGLILLLVGEGISSRAQVERRMRIDEGTTASFTYDDKEVELAVVDASASDRDRHIVIPAARMEQGGVIDDPQLPFEIRVNDFYTNSRIAGPRQTDARPKATAGNGTRYSLIGRARASGVGEDIDIPAAYVTPIARDGRTLGTYLVSIQPLEDGFQQVDEPQEVRVGEKTYTLQLRFKRTYRPYSVHLIDFKHDVYLGTKEPKNFSSQIRFIDPAHNVDREVVIRMNEPLRYRGETFYQSSFVGETTTILQVVKNPSLVLPYTACVIGGLGLVLHFLIALVNFIRREGLEETAKTFKTLMFVGSPVGAFLWLLTGAFKTPAGRGAGAPHPAAPTDSNEYTLQPKSALASMLVPAGVALLAFVIVAANFVTSLHMAAPGTAPAGAGHDLSSFSELPISYEGRVQPLDSLARNHLRIIAGRESPTVDGSSLDPNQWLIEVLTRREHMQIRERAGKSFADPGGNYKVVRIDFTDIKDALKLDAKRKYFSPMEIFAEQDEFQRQFERLKATPKEQRDLFQNRFTELVQKLEIYQTFGNKTDLFLVPPLKPGEDWLTVGDAFRQARRTGEVPASAQPLQKVLEAYATDDPVQFNRAVQQYHTQLAQSSVPMRKVKYEAFFNRFDPFYIAQCLYVGAFLLVVFAWIGFNQPLRRSAFALVLLALLVHTFGLVSRIYISGRPPVTNLASSAIFIAWVVVLLAVFIEGIFRNTLGSLVATLGGFLSLLIAYRLSLEGDTMKVLTAVLDTNFWLATHVVAITLGYAATFLAGICAMKYVVGWLLIRLGLRTAQAMDLTGPPSPELRRKLADFGKTLIRVTYGVTCFAIIFSFVGTVLGGIWADQSWGRFWGWDPKENGAVLIVLANALLLHARWGGIARERGIVCLALFGNIVTAWSWFGVNMLGIGLHSYGFMESAAMWLTLFIVLQLVLIGIGIGTGATAWRLPGDDGGPAGAGRAFPVVQPGRRR